MNRRTLTFLSPVLGFAMLFGLTGCGDTSTEVADGETKVAESNEASPSTAAGKESSSTEADTASPVDTASPANASTSDTETPKLVDDNTTKYLSIPSAVTGRAREAYVQLRSMADDSDAISLANFANASQGVAVTLTQKGDETNAFEFIFQSADLMRSADKLGEEQLVDDYFVQAFYFEGVARALSGQFEKSIKSFDEAVEKGFGQFEAIERDPELAKLRSQDGFAEKLAEWKKVAIAREEEAITEELAQGKLFDFQFTGTDINGQPVDVAALKGKVTIVDIWGTWCPPCRAEVPSFVKLQETYGEDGFQMVGLNFERGANDEENLQKVKDSIVSLKINYPCAMGDDAVLEQVPEFEGYPTTLFIDKAGNVRMKAVGAHPYEYLEMVVKKLLEEEA